MKTAKHPRRPRATWLFLAAPALLATPAFAQDVAPAPPPPVRATVPQAAPPATPPPVATPTRAQTPPPSRETGVPVEPNTANPASRTRIAPGAADVVDEARQPAARAERTPARQVTRTMRTTTRTTPAASAPAPAPAPDAVAPAPETVAAPAPAPATEPATPVADTTADTTATETTTTADEGGAPLWPIFALIALAIVGGIGFFAWRRRREAAYEEYYVEEPAYMEAEPAPMTIEPEVEPVRAAPVAAAAAAAPSMAFADPAPEPVAAVAEDATVTDAEAEDVAALTDGAAPVRNRPWLEFAMRPVRAGTNADEALVEIELTVANSGNVPAQDVRVSTFMLTDANASEMESMLVAPPADAAVDPVTIAPGEGTRIDATLAALKADLGGASGFTPVVVADARYTLPDGSEGRTSASFVVGVSHDGALTPFDLADRVMRDDIEARLHGDVEHA